MGEEKRDCDNYTENQTTLDEMKKEWALNYSMQMHRITSLFEVEYKKYLKDPNHYNGKDFDFEKLIDNSKNMKPQLIPYSALTEIIFKNDMSIEYLTDDAINESTFANIIEGWFEAFLIKKFNVDKSNNSQKTGITEESIFGDEEISIINKNEIIKKENEIIICYKIIEHLKLAISQKEGLYVKQKKEINDLAYSLKESKALYDNMISNYISILGIFAAILMTTFGGIQAFTSIYRDNKFNLVDSLLIACIGFLGILLMMFLLLNSIAKLSNKSIDSGNKGDIWYLRHPTFINSFIILSTLALIFVSYKITMNPPQISWWGTVYLVPTLYLYLMVKFFDNFSFKHILKKNRGK